MNKGKNSGIPWIGIIPDNWKVIKIKHLKNNEENSFIDGDWIESPYITNEGIRYYTTGNIGDGHFKDQGNGYISEETFDVLNCKYAYAGDLVFSRLNAPYGRSCILPNPPDKCVLAVDNVILRTDEDKRYICYATQCSGYQDSVFDKAAGTTMKRISRTNLGNIRIPLPPLVEQQAIADYLDERCSKIDEIIAEATASIEEYKELKQAVIYETVTKGLDKNVPMKDSGVQWIGEIPCTWSIEKIKNHGVARNGLTYSPADMTDETNGVLVIRSSNIQDGKWDYHDNVYVKMKIPEDLILREGDIVICSRNGSKKLIGKNALVEGGNLNTFGAFMMVYRSNIKNKRYMYWILNSGMFGYYLPMFFTSTINQLTRANFNQMVFPYTSSEVEQKQIVQYLDNQLIKYDAIISEKQALINDLQAYKKSLIYEVVTGKRRVV